MTRSFIIGFVLIFHFSMAQPPIPDVDFPVPRDKASFLYFSLTKEMLLVGGSSLIPDPIENDVWRWNGQRWTKTKANGPGSRAFFEGVLNTKTNTIFSFGGIAIGLDGLQLQNAKSDAWQFDGRKWSDLPIKSIGTRHHHHLVYADHLDAFVLYGGFGENRADTTTWLLKNGTFTPLHISSPGIRYQSGMVYDRNRKRVVLYGGGDKPDEHWEFDGDRWKKIITTINPGIKYHARMVYDEKRKAVILHGGWVDLNGQNPKNHETPATWQWNGQSWTKISEVNVFPIAIGFDRNTQSVVAYAFDQGNPNVTRGIGMWRLDGKEWKSIQQFGAWNALDYLQSQAEAYPSVTSLTLYGDRLRTARKYYEAEQAYKKLEKLGNGNTAARINIAEMLLMQNKTTEAHTYLNLVTSSETINRDAYIRLANALLNATVFKDAALFYEKALEIQPRGSDFYNLACIYAKVDDREKSFANLFKAVEYGIASKSTFENDADLAPLKSDNRWKLLMEKLNQ